jgi:transposase
MAEPIGTGKFTTEWDYVPGYFVCRRHIQEVVACRCGQHIARAEAPLRVFDRTQYGPGLIAYLIVTKCGDAMPTYRAEKHFARLGVPIARSTLGDLIHRAAEILSPLYDALLARIVSDAHCQADETSFRLQNRPDKRGFVWTFLTGKQIAYVFSGDRSGQTPSRVLGGTTGSLVVDAYTGYNDVTDVDGRTRCGCFWHYLELGAIWTVPENLREKCGNRAISLRIKRTLGPGPRTETGGRVGPTYAEKHRSAAALVQRQRVYAVSGIVARVSVIRSERRPFVPSLLGFVSLRPITRSSR